MNVMYVMYGTYVLYGMPVLYVVKYLCMRVCAYACKCIGMRVYVCMYVCR